ncbi:hypothetical protein AM2_1985 [Lactococcus cremoris]|nr:hypothetical protein llh_4770 [Lactococcus cremoris subsp. cremoris A76]KZK13286.1 hypothetical protein AB995_0674 [Lactococcus cremoris]KZK33721.1 hypothetical protein N41_2448 [Lactococcus cremoris]KZK42131.1 hypothetical protein LMG6897_0779 [Lactococcus cremoris]KZK45560.1 hypothetical protein SK110_1963 [Lactococcus cremoris]
MRVKKIVTTNQIFSVSNFLPTERSHQRIAHFASKNDTCRY